MDDLNNPDDVDDIDGLDDIDLVDLEDLGEISAPNAWNAYHWRSSPTLKLPATNSANFLARFMYHRKLSVVPVVRRHGSDVPTLLTASRWSISGVS